MSNNNIRILSEPVACPEIKKMPNVIISGIYKIENTVNHKVYIGQSKNIINRFKRGHLLPHTVCNSYLKAAFEKYGYENFTVEVIKETYDLDYWEIFLIQIYKATDKRYGYNICIGGEGGDTFSGRHHTEETKRKKSEAMKKFYSGKIWTDEERYAMGNHCRGKHLTEEQKQRISKKLKGVINKGPKSEEHKRKIAETLKGNIPWNKGVKMTEEQRLQQIEIKRKLYDSPQGEIIKQKLREANTGLYYWNNGEIEIHSKEAPEGFIRGRLKKSEKQQGLLRWNNGKINVYSRECPGEDFVRGMLPKHK